MLKTKSDALDSAPDLGKGYAKARIKIEQRIKEVMAQFYNKYAFNEFTFSSIELSKKCGVRDYASRTKEYYLLQTYRGNSISKKISTYRLRQEHFDEEMHQLAKDLFTKEPIELKEVPLLFDSMRYVTFNINNIRAASGTSQFAQTDKFKLKQLERALLIYGVQEDPNNDHLVTLGIPHKQIGSRLYSTWPFCLQCTSSDLRQMSIHGDSIDLDAAAVQCMVDLGAQYGGGKDELATLKYYITHKRQLRTDLALEYDVSEETIKCIFNIMVLGGHGSFAQVRANYRDTNSIARLVGDSTRASEIVSDKFIHSFYLAVKTLRRIIVDAMHVATDDGWQLTNSAGNTKTWTMKAHAKRKVKPVAKMMSFVYMGWELATMEANVDNTSDRGLPVHDAREGIADLEDVCNKFDSNDIRYEVTINEHNNNARFIFPEIPINNLIHPS